MSRLKFKKLPDFDLNGEYKTTNIYGKKLKIYKDSSYYGMDNWYYTFINSSKFKNSFCQNRIDFESFLNKIR
jgi:hypothetical protein